MAAPGGPAVDPAAEPGPVVDPLPNLEVPTTDVTGFCTINERGIGSLNLLDLSNTIIINLIVFVFLLLVFERMRGKRSVYFCRDEW